MTKTLTYPALLIACIIVIVSFITATNYQELSFAVILFILLDFFILQILPHKVRFQQIKKTLNKATFIDQAETEPMEEPVRAKVEVSDIDKRVFLKLIGGAGLLLFLSSIFNKRAENMFFDRVPLSSKLGFGTATPSGNYPPAGQQLEGYRIAEFDDNEVAYYGFTNSNGKWYVMKVDTQNGNFRYSAGDSNFPSSWENREKLNYDYYNNVFK